MRIHSACAGTQVLTAISLRRFSFSISKIAGILKGLRNKRDGGNYTDMEIVGAQSQGKGSQEAARGDAKES